MESWRLVSGNAARAVRSGSGKPQEQVQARKTGTEICAELELRGSESGLEASRSGSGKWKEVQVEVQVERSVDART